MIPRVHPRGGRVGGLVRYLYGPGKKEEHVNPRLVAAWDGAGDLADLEPGLTAAGKRDFRQLVGLLEEPIDAAYRRPDKPVWHCSVRLAPQDRTLSDAEWGHIAREMMAQAGLAPNGDDRAVRWIAVRHGDDHIHLAATLVRQDGRREPAFRDFVRCRTAARDLEERYGLYSTAPTDRTADRTPEARELNKAARQHRRETPRDRLRREVRHAAAAAASSEEFFGLLREAGLEVRLRHSEKAPDQVTGYSVALPGATTAAGAPVFFGGGRLAPDLTLPQLRARWGELPGPITGRPAPKISVADRATLYEQAAEQVRAAVTEIRERAPHDRAGAAATAYAAADVLTVTARAVEGDTRGPLTRAAEAVTRAAREPYGGHPDRTERAEGLRAMSRLLALAGKFSDDKDALKALRLIIQLSLLADTLADLRDAQERLQQARTARLGARRLRQAAARAGSATGTGAACSGGNAPAAVAPPATPSPTPRRDRRRQARRPAGPGPRL